MGPFTAHIKKKEWTGALVAAGLLAFGGLSSASAQQPTGNPILESRFHLAVGGFFPHIDSDVRIAGEQDVTVDFEDTLGLDDRAETFWAQARWRFARRHAVEFEFIQLDRDDTLSADETFTIGDTTANVGAQLDTTFNVALGRLTYGWSFVKDEKKALTFLVGAHIAHSEAEVELSGNIEDAETGTSLAGSIVQEDDELTVPLPHVGARVEYALTPRMLVDVTAIGFAIKIGDLEGTLLEAHGDVQYLLWRNFALGAGLRYFRFDLEDDADEGKNEFDFEYFGPVVFVSASF